MKEFNIGERVIPLSPCLLVAGTIVEEMKPTYKGIKRYKIKLDRIFGDGITEVHRQSFDLELTDIKPEDYLPQECL